MSEHTARRDGIEAMKALLELDPIVVSPAPSTSAAPAETTGVGPREAIYDERIAPLMRQIIDVCKASGLPFYASFALDGDMACTSQSLPRAETLPEDERDAYEQWRAKHLAVSRAIRATPTLATHLTVRNGAGEITHMETIL